MGHALMLKGENIIVVMPVYNGGKTLTDVVKRLPKGVVKKVIIVDDGSSDNSLKVAHALALDDDNDIKILSHEENKGYGGAQKTLFNAALADGGDIVVLLHQDGQYAPEDIPKLIHPLLTNKSIDIVLGPRQNMLEGGMPLIKYIGNRTITFLQNMMLGLNLSEFHTGFRAYSARALKKVDFNSCTNEFHFDTEILIEAKDKKLKIAEVPVATYYGDDVSQNWGICRYGFNCLMSVIKYKLSKLASYK